MFKNTTSKGISVLDWGFLVTDQVPPFSQRMASALISDQVGTHPSITSEWPCTHIWSCKTTSHSHIRMALSPKLSIPGNWPGASIPRMAFNTYIWSSRNQYYSHIKMAQHSHLTMCKHIAPEWISTYIRPCANTPHQKGSALTFDHVWKGSVLISGHARNQSSMHFKRALHSHLIM